jgi:16S rRNA processing protein RimM
MKGYLFPVGRVTKPHGVKGKLKVEYFGEDLESFSLYKEVVIKDALGRPETFEIAEVALQPPRLILRLKGIDRIEEAEPLVGKELFAEKGILPELGKGEYYWLDLLGMTVETEKGNKIGRVKEILPTGANDVFVIDGKRGELLLPATEEVIQEVDLEKRVIKVVRIEGLWEEEDEV